MSSIVMSNLHGHAVPGGPVEISRLFLCCGSEIRSNKPRSLSSATYVFSVSVRETLPVIQLCFGLPHTHRKACCARAYFKLFSAVLGGKFTPSSASSTSILYSIVDQALMKTVCKYMDLLVPNWLWLVSCLFLRWGSESRSPQIPHTCCIYWALVTSNSLDCSAKF